MARPSRPLLAICMPTIVLAVAYVSWNISSFGTLLPISGRVKLHWVEMLAAEQRFAALIEIPWVGHHLVARALSAFGAPALTIPLAGALLVVLGVVLWLARDSIRASMEAAGVRFIVIGCAARFLVDHLMIERLVDRNNFLQGFGGDFF